ncbi:hypothetical protein C8Q79DRAFT_732537 [Trametes meyenii]|nr:hypothetical protein C8Q79DRAFT_732537 [Trametes meyenii]
MFAPTQQPRWVLLSVFLFLWSLSSGLRRDGRSRTLGLGVDARAHMPVADTMLDMLGDSESERLGIWKRQVAIPTCAALCAAQAGDAVGCGEGLNLGCACHSPSFLPDTVNCMESNCTSKDSQLGQQAIQSACLRIGRYRFFFHVKIPPTGLTLEKGPQLQRLRRHPPRRASRSPARRSLLARRPFARPLRPRPPPSPRPSRSPSPSHPPAPRPHLTLPLRPRRPPAPYLRLTLRYRW